MRINFKGKVRGIHFVVREIGGVWRIQLQEGRHQSFKKNCRRKNYDKEKMIELVEWTLKKTTKNERKEIECYSEQ